MSNNNDNKKPLDLTESLLVFDKAQAPSITTVNVGDVELGIPEINRVAAAPQNLVQSAEASTTTPTVNELDYDGISLVERRSKDVRPWEKNDSLGISGINQPDVTTRNLSRSDELTIGFLLDCAKRGQNRGNQRQPSICKVSRMLRDHSESSYEPQLVSIGPIHKEDPKLKEFEWLKERYLDDLLNRCNSTPKETLEACLQKVNDLMPQIRESYAGVMKNYSDVELARMMVMDGCFILEFCFKHKKENEYLPNKMQNNRIAMDLILLENQVPFSVLQALFDCSMGEQRHFTLSKVLDYYYLSRYIKLFRVLPEKNSIFSKYLIPYVKRFCSLLPEKSSTTDVDSDSTPPHVLGYLHKRYQLQAAKLSKPIHTAKLSKPIHTETSMFVPPEEGIGNTAVHSIVELDLSETSMFVPPEEGIGNTAVHSIVELDLSGMKFKPHQENEWSMTIKFQFSMFTCISWLWICSCCCCCCCCCLFPCLPWFLIKPTIQMPTLVIDHFTELILRNFIAYEQLSPQARDCFTSYAVAMDMLIDTQEDVAKLVESKVFVNMLGTNQEAADMINKVCKNISITDFCYTHEFKEMDMFCNLCLPKHTARLRRVYFSNPWSIIALVAAIILFGLTVVQTIFTIKAA